MQRFICPHSRNMRFVVADSAFLYKKYRKKPFFRLIDNSLTACYANLSKLYHALQTPYFHVER